MFEVDAAIYLKSTKRTARLEKPFAMSAMPRTDEFIKVINHELGDYFAFQVTQVTHREGGRPEIWLRLVTMINGKNQEDQLPDENLDEYVQSYVAEGWKLASCIVRKSHQTDSA